MNICFVMIQRKSLDFIVMRTFKTQKLVGICVRVCVCYLGLSIGIVSNIYIYPICIFLFNIYIYYMLETSAVFFQITQPFAWTSHAKGVKRENNTKT